MRRDWRVRIINKEQEDELNRLDWASRDSEERVDAVSFLRRQCLIAMGYQDLPRIKKVLRVVAKQE